MMGPEPIHHCTTCRNYDFHQKAGSNICKAFPTGIPREIMEGFFDHIYPHDGDHGVRYEKMTEVEEKTLRIEGEMRAEKFMREMWPKLRTA